MIEVEAGAAADAAWQQYWGDLILAVEVATRHGDLDLAHFLLARGRLPRLGEERQPWEYRGWLIPYTADMLPVDGAPGRWGWWLEGVVAGRPLRPIPRLSLGSPGAETLRNLERVRGVLAESQGWSSATSELLRWLGWGLAVSEEPPGLQPAVAEALYRTLDLSLWRKEPADYLGHLMCEDKGRSFDPSAFFPTPMGICNMMAQMLYEDPGYPANFPASLYRTVLDPCVGTGRMLLAASNYSVALHGQDINPRCVLATRVNLAFYAPWGAYGFPRCPEVGEIPEQPPALEPARITTQFDEGGQGLLFGGMNDE